MHGSLTIPLESTLFLFRPVFYFCCRQEMPGFCGKANAQQNILKFKFEIYAKYKSN
jgi:hypothetical protein